jgi:glutaconate CoA-transferase, subunit B
MSRPAAPKANTEALLREGAPVSVELDPVASARVDQMVAAMSAYVQDGDLLGEGIGTFLSNAAYMLAKHTHAPDCISLCPNGNTLMTGPRPLSLGRDEALTVPRALVGWTYIDVNLCYMPSAFIGGRPRWTEFMRPAQIDAHGWTNNVQIGGPATGVRLPGAAGIPDATSVSRRVFYYLPRHTRQVLVERLDHASGVGNPRRLAAGEAAPKKIVVVSELCVLESDGEGRLDVLSLHAGVSREQVDAATGFVLPWRRPPKTTEAPSAAQLMLLQRQIDPQGLRRLESLSGRERRAALRRLLDHEAAAGPQDASA